MRQLSDNQHDAVMAISYSEGDDLFFILGYLGRKGASSMMCRLKRKGLAYTYRSNGTIEAWLHPKGRDYAASQKK